MPRTAGPWMPAGCPPTAWLSASPEVLNPNPVSTLGPGGKGRVWPCICPQPRLTKPRYLARDLVFSEIVNSFRTSLPCQPPDLCSLVGDGYRAAPSRWQPKRRGRAALLPAGISCWPLAGTSRSPAVCTCTWRRAEGHPHPHPLITAMDLATGGQQGGVHRCASKLVRPRIAALCGTGSTLDADSPAQTSRFA